MCHTPYSTGERAVCDLAESRALCKVSAVPVNEKFRRNAYFEDAMPGCVAHTVLYWRGRKQAVHSKEMRRWYTKNVGPIPEGEHVHHLCGNPWCVAPEHLATVAPEGHRLAHVYRRLYYGFDETFSP